MYILIAILAFGLLIFVHELGHFLVAKACGVKVTEFAIGMGPQLLKKQGKETVYSLRVLPVGGFCAMEGEDEASEDPRAFNNQSVLRRILILTGQSSDRPHAGEEPLVQGVIDFRVRAFDSEVAENFIDCHQVYECQAALIRQIRTLCPHIQKLYRISFLQLLCKLCISSIQTGQQDVVLKRTFLPDQVFNGHSFFDIQLFSVFHGIVFHIDIHGCSIPYKKELVASMRQPL